MEKGDGRREMGAGEKGEMTIEGEDAPTARLIRLNSTLAPDALDMLVILPEVVVHAICGVVPTTNLSYRRDLILRVQDRKDATVRARLRGV